jgi:hypothetical protein
MRITYCPKKHKVQINDDHYPVIVYEEDELGPTSIGHTIDCYHCYNLYYRRAPFKAKRSGES